MFSLGCDCFLVAVLAAGFFVVVAFFTGFLFATVLVSAFEAAVVVLVAADLVSAFLLATDVDVLLALFDIAGFFSGAVFVTFLGVGCFVAFPPFFVDVSFLLSESFMPVAPYAVC